MQFHRFTLARDVMTLVIAPQKISDYYKKLLYDVVYEGFEANKVVKSEIVWVYHFVCFQHTMPHTSCL